MRLRAFLLGFVGMVMLASPVGASAEAGCPNESLRQGLSANLPDCRAYELVTPPYKQGARVVLDAMSLDGSRLIVHSTGNFGDAANSQSIYGARYELTRGPSGWMETNIDPPASQFPYDEYLDATPDLSKTLFELRAASQSVRAIDFWVRDADGTLHDLGPALPPSETEGPSGLGFVQSPGNSVQYDGASSDLSKVLFNSNRVRWPGDTTFAEGNSLYEYTAGHSGPPALVGEGEDGSLIGECGVHLGPVDGLIGVPPGAISADGSVVFFSVSGANRSNCGLKQPPVDEIFARTEQSKAIAISEAAANAQCTTAACQGAPPADAQYIAASQDGAKVFFTSTQQLTDAASEDSAVEDSATGAGCQATSGPSGCNLYEYDFKNPAGHNLVLVSAGDPNPQVQGVLSVSTDGSHLYFVARGVLTHAANQYGAGATAGAENLYVFERDAQAPDGRTSFIGTLSAEDSFDWAGPVEGIVATTTPDGRYLVFPSVADLTPDDTSAAQQVFRYDARSGELLRVSIGQAGFNRNGNSDTLSAAAPLGSRRTVAPRPAAMSDDGAYVVFQSADGLTPDALNARMTNVDGVLAQNVYEYHDGNVRLISDGQDASSFKTRSSVQVEGTVALGGDVFFQTADPLVQQDGDTQRDIYDARIDGGSPFAAPPAICQGDACQGSFAPTPVSPGPGSSTYSGPGNLEPSAATPAKHVSPKAKKRKAKPGKHRPRKHRRHGGKAGRVGPRK